MADGFEFEKLSESQTRFSFDGKMMVLNEMSISRARRFVQLAMSEWQEVAQEIGSPDMQAKSIEDVLAEYGDPLFDRITKLFNFAFEYRNPDYQPVDREWLMDHLPVRALKSIAKELLEQNQMGQLLPFFQSLGERLRVMASVVASEALKAG